VARSPSDRWRRVDELFHLTLSRPAEEREAFLETACAGDPVLLADVRSLVSADAAEGGCEDWVPQVAAAWVSERSPSLAGSLVGRYRVLERLGAGSMGEVYRAEDTALRRQIALKILPARFVRHPDRIRRFEQEARAASSLNHPNIVTIHEIGAAGDVHFIASELVEGDTLRARLNKSALRLDEAVDVAVQVAAGLAAAHAARAIHRDIKPENLVIRPDGLVKIVDFGLAKLIQLPDGRRSRSPTRITRAGTTPGTLSYMSPEQVLGEALDARTDLFSHRTSAGSAASFTLPATSLMNMARAPGSDAFAWSSQFGGHVIQRLDLDVDGERVVQGPVALTPKSRSLAQPDLSPDGRWLVANTRGEAREDLVVLRTDGTEVRALTADEFRDRGARWSPDGQRVAFWSDRDGLPALYVIHTDGSQLQRIASSPGRGPCCPVWAPDGDRLVYLAGDLTLHAIDFTESANIARRDALFARLPDGVWFEPVAWSRDGTRLAGQERRGNNPRSGIALYDIRTGQYRVLTRSGGKPNWMADDRRIVYSDASGAFILDSISQRIRPLFSVAPYQNNDVTIGKTGELFVSVRAVEADVWVTRRK
jgi:hypothetical protein